MPEHLNRVSLERSLSPATIWAIALGSIIGWGCFILPHEFMTKAGPLGTALGLLVGAGIMIVIGCSVSYMTAEIPVAGGQIAYAYKTFGRHHAYFCGWMLSLGFLSIIALNATALSVLAKFLVPEWFTIGYLYTVAGWDVYIGEILLASFVIMLFAYLNIRGGTIAGKIQVIMIVFLIVAVALMTGGTLISSKTSFSNLIPAFPYGKKPIECILAIVAMSPFLYVGFDTVPQLAEEYDFPASKTLVLVCSAIISGAALYLCVSISTGMVWPWTEMVASQYTWATGTAMRTATGNFGVIFLLIAICMGIFTGINGFYLASSRLIFGMARAKMLPEFFLKKDLRYNTPINAIIFSMIVSLIAPWFGRQVINWVVDMCSVGTAIGYFYTCAGAYLVLKKHSAVNSPNSISPLTAIAGGIFSILILLLLLIPGAPGSMTIYSWIALLVWISVGFIIYLFCRKKFITISTESLDFLILGKQANGQQ